MTIRIPFDIDQELRKLADANTRTLAAQVLHIKQQEWPMKKRLRCDVKWFPPAARTASGQCNKRRSS